MHTSFKSRLAKRELLVGTIVTLSSPEVAEILGHTGLDWLFVDLEHSTLDTKAAQVILQTAGAQATCVVRVPLNDEIWIKKVLDIGSPGLIVPLVRNAEQARQAVRWCKYPPDGVRSVGIGRAHGYGPGFQAYVRSANETTAVILQIEHIDAVNNIEKILNVNGIDCLFVGPYDLSASMGRMGRVDDADVQKAIAHVTECATHAKMPLGIFGATPGAVLPYIESGFSLIAVSMDTLLLGNAARDVLSAFNT